MFLGGTLLEAFLVEHNIHNPIAYDTDVHGCRFKMRPEYRNMLSQVGSFTKLLSYSIFRQFLIFFRPFKCFNQVIDPQISSALFAICPLALNMSAYSLILYKLYAVRSERARVVSFRAFLICGTFTLSWLPFVVLYDILQLTSIVQYLHAFLYLNCLTDPALYAFSSRIIKHRLDQLKRAKSRIRSRISNAMLIGPTLRVKVEVEIKVGGTTVGRSEGNGKCFVAVQRNRYSIESEQ